MSALRRSAPRAISAPRVLSLVALALLLPACLGDFLVDQMDFDREEKRQGMLKLADNGTVTIFAAHDTVSASAALEYADFLREVHGHYRELLGPLPARKARLYLHTPANYGSQVISSAARAWCDDFSMDAQDKDPLRLPRILAHELGHLATCGEAGGNARLFLNEGMAEYLAASLPMPLFNHPLLHSRPGTAADELSEESLCDPDWPLADLLTGAGWLQHKGDYYLTYTLAALFTEVAISRVGAARYLEEFFWPAAEGTAAGVETLAVQVLGLSFDELARAMRRAALLASSGLDADDLDYLWPAPPEQCRCPGTCTCNLTGQVTPFYVCLPPGVTR